jgi:hypothetical protein
MDTLTTSDIIAYCHDEDVDLITYLNENKINGRFLSLVPLNELPPTARFPFRYLLQTIHFKFGIQTQHQPPVASSCAHTPTSSNETVNQAERPLSSTFSDAIRPIDPNFEREYYTPVYTPLLPRDSNCTSNAENSFTPLSNTLPSSIDCGQKQHSAIEQSEAINNNENTENEPPITLNSSIRKKKTAMQKSNPKWPSNFTYPYEKLDDKLVIRLRKPTKLISDSVLQKIIIKALFDKIYVDLKV